MVAKVCPKCASKDIESEGPRGELVCTNCGHVLEECATAGVCLSKILVMPQVRHLP